MCALFRNNIVVWVTNAKLLNVTQPVSNGCMRYDTLSIAEVKLHYEITRHVRKIVGIYTYSDY